MDNSKKTSFDDRLNAAANAKKAELEKFRARSGGKDPGFAERQAARQAVGVARDARAVGRNTARLAGIARDADVARQAADDVAVEAERKAARDARYAARKARPRK